MSMPYLSVVLASRNDDYAGGMLTRLQVFINSFLEQADHHKLASELVLVDWNPPPDRLPLKDALSWSDRNDFCTVRVIKVPPSVHRRLKFSDKLPILIHRARNVGVRRARGKFILPTSPDILFSDKLIQIFASRELKTELMYRTYRYDVPEYVMQLPSLNSRLAYCEQNILRVYGQSNMVMDVNGHPVLHTNASGDFTLLSRDFYFKLHGIPEETEYHSVHFDSVFCYMAYASGAKEEILRDPMRIYHIEHALSSWRLRKTWLDRLLVSKPVRGLRSYVPKRFRRRIVSLARKVVPSRSEVERLGVPQITWEEAEQIIDELLESKRPIAYNNDSWGLAHFDLVETVVLHALWDS